MKLSIITLFILAFSLIEVSAQSELDDLRTSKRIVTWTDSDLPKYSIQIASAATPPSDASFVKDLDVVYEYNTNNSVKYFYGKYSSYAEANKDLQSVRDQGFSDAFVSSMKKFSSSSSANNKIETIGHKKIDIDPSKDYVIQVGAFRYPLYVSYFENVGKIYEYRLNDKIFRYTTKPMKGSAVESELQRIKSLGYDAAFIVEYETYAPFRIE